MLVDTKVKTILASSGTGKFYNLMAEQRNSRIEAVVQEVKGEVLVVAMIIDCGTQR